MTKTLSVLTAVLVAAAGCAPHGPFRGPLVAADTASLPEARATDRPALQTAIVLPAIPGPQLRDTIVIRYVVDTSGLADPRTFELIRGHDGTFIKAVERAIEGMRYTPSEQGGRRVRSWTRMEVRPGGDRGVDIDVELQ